MGPCWYFVEANDCTSLKLWQDGQALAAHRPSDRQTLFLKGVDSGRFRGQIAPNSTRSCVPCTLSCAGGLTVGHMHARGYAWGWLASRRRVRPGRVWWGFRVQEVSVRYVAFPFPSPLSFSWLGCRVVLNPGFLHTAVSSPFPYRSATVKFLYRYRIHDTCIRVEESDR